MNKMKKICASDIMSTNLKTLHPKDKIARAKEIFNQFDIHHIPVVVMGDLRGIISLGDLLFLEGIVTNSFDEFLRTKKYQLATVDEIMTQKPFCVEFDTLIEGVIDLMIEKRINSLPVKKSDELVGIITNFDILKYLRKQLN